ncbi:hypothetical protein EMEDMD4_310147 [Sinorhizobium medicae]|uniref:Uncharacterized protein n=1 Tax=Sinorhizobium medicae TaxID=110321 RepID=A0A508WWN2_9HYPH|nr:hypothetical protein EMEDMD4_310147 [Sinorhizobium medicae]
MTERYKSFAFFLRMAALRAIRWAAMDPDDFRLDQPEIMNGIDSEKTERNAALLSLRDHRGQSCQGPRASCRPCNEPASGRVRPAGPAGKRFRASHRL